MLGQGQGKFSVGERDDEYDEGFQENIERGLKKKKKTALLGGEVESGGTGAELGIRTYWGRCYNR